MDPFTFATLVGLLAAFQGRRDKAKTDDLEGFKMFLAESRHENVAASLENNAELSKSIKAFLQQSNNVVLEQLSAIESILTGVASRMEGFSGIASSVDPSRSLSGQAISILQQIEDRQVGEFIIDHMGPDIVLLYLGGVGGSHTPSESRYVKDDLQDLVNCGFLLPTGFNSSGKPKFSVTRQASAFISQLEEG